MLLQKVLNLVRTGVPVPIPDSHRGLHFKDYTLKKKKTNTRVVSKKKKKRTTAAGSHVLNLVHDIIVSLQLYYYKFSTVPVVLHSTGTRVQTAFSIEMFPDA